METKSTAMDYSKWHTSCIARHLRRMLPAGNCIPGVRWVHWVPTIFLNGLQDGHPDASHLIKLTLAEWDANRGWRDYCNQDFHDGIEELRRRVKEGVA